MKSEQAKVIRSLLASATLALLHIPAGAGEAAPVTPDGHDKEKILPGDTYGRRIDKNVYKIMRDGATKLIAAHRSHSSHRSHRSSSPADYSRSAKKRAVRAQSLYSQDSQAPRKLGERALGQGMRGTDVDRLVAYLVRFYYLHEEDAVSATGECEYNGKVVDAVRHFQRDAGYTEDGKFTGAMAERLMQWDPARTTITLGFRPLSATAKMSGHDVDTLVELLIAAGCAPDATKLTRHEGHYIFTADICTALKVFQATRGLRPSGELDEATVNKLNGFRK